MLNTQNQHRPLLLLLTGLLLLGLMAPPVLAQSPKDTIRAMMEKRDREIKQAIKPLVENPETATDEQRTQAASLINDQIDFEEMGRQALGKYWADLTEEQRTEFINVFSTIVRSQSLADLNAYNATVVYEQILVDGDKAHVKTTASIEDKKLPVEYKLGAKTGTWWLYDIILDGVGTIDGYATSFQTAIRKRGFDTFMELLYKRRDKIKANS